MRALFGGTLSGPTAPRIPGAKWVHPFRLKRISKAIETIDRKFILNGQIKEETAKAAAKDIFSREDYIKNTNKSVDKLLSRNRSSPPALLWIYSKSEGLYC